MDFLNIIYCKPNNKSEGVRTGKIVLTGLLSASRAAYFFWRRVTCVSNIVLKFCVYLITPSKKLIAKKNKQKRSLFIFHSHDDHLFEVQIIFFAFT